MQRVPFAFSILVLLIVVSTPQRFAYAAAPQSDPTFAAGSAIEHALHSLAASLTPPLHNPPPNIEAMANAGQQALHTTIAAASHALAQVASAWSSWVSLANADLTSKVRVASIPPTAAVIVSQTGANAPPSATTPSSALPTPHLTLTGTSSGQSTANIARYAADLTPAAPSGYVTQDALAAQLSNLRSLIYQLAANTTTAFPSPSLAANGNGVYYGDTAAPVIQLNGTTLNNVTVNGVSGLTLSEIPSLSGTYLPLTGGTLNVATLNATTTSSTNFTAIDASSTNLSNFGTAYFGGSATSSFDSSGDFTVVGTTSVGILDLSKNILSTIVATAAPTTLASWNSITTAFSGDDSHMGLGLSHKTTGTSLGTPSSGYLEIPELAAIASYDSNSSGYNASTTSNSGRTGALNFYAKNDNYGQGDSTSYFCNNFAGSSLSGATTFLAEPEVGCLGGQEFAGANGDFLEGLGDIDFHDGNYDASVAGLVFNFNRGNATGNLNANWSGLELQNQGTYPINSELRASGPARIGLDLTGLTFPDETPVSIALSNGGAGYSVGDLLTPPDGTYAQQTVIQVLSVNGSGTIQTFGLNRAGLYSVPPASPSTVSGGTGSGAAFVLQYSTSGNPAIVTPANDCWYGNASNDLSVFSTAYSSTAKLGNAWVCYTSSLGAWNFVTGNNSVLQLYNNQVIANTTFKAVGSVSIGTTTSPAATLEVAGSGYFTGGLGVGLLNAATGTLQTSGIETIGGLSTLQSGFVSQASSTVVGNFTSTGNGIIGGDLALNGTAGTTTIASGQGFTVGNSQFIVQQGSGNVGIGSNPLSNVSLTINAASTNYNAFSVAHGGTGLINGFVDGSDNGWFTLENSSGVIQTRLAGAGSGTSSYVNGSNGANFGVGTTTPYARLSVWGPDAASSTLAFNVVNNASTTVFAVFDGGNAQLSGTLTQSSDQRLKTNIQSLDASSSLSLINALNPVTFTWINPDEGTTPQLGFIAQQVQQIFPNLVSTTSATALTPGGTLGLNYIGLISPIVSAIQSLSGEVQNLITEVQGFAQSFTSAVGNFGQVNTNELCVSNGPNDPAPLCVTKAQLAALLAAGDQSPAAAQPSPAAPSTLPESVTQNAATSTQATTPPTITDTTESIGAASSTPDTSSTSNEATSTAQ